MTVTGHSFGHPVEWVYSDTKESATEGKRPCPKCGKFPTKEGYDPCWGELPNVKAACCGHGVTKPYVLLMDGTQLKGQEAIDYATGKNRDPIKPFNSLYLKAGVQTKIMIHKNTNEIITETLEAADELHLNSGSTKLRIEISEWKNRKRK